MKLMNLKFIALKKPTYDQLRNLGRKGQTFDEIVCCLLEKVQPEGDGTSFVAAHRQSPDARLNVGNQLQRVGDNE
jgi:hypothetical protein